MTDRRQVSKTELEAWAELVAAFHARTGRDPDERETDSLVMTAREMAANGQELVNCCCPLSSIA